MKKLFLILTLVLLSCLLTAQKKSNYEKYWQAREDSINKTQTVAQAPVEYDDLYYQPSKDAKKIKKQKRSNVDQIVDTIVKYNPEVRVTYEYNYDSFFYSYNIGRFYHGGFNYWMYGNPWYYSSWMYDPYDFYWDMRFSGYPYWSYPYYSSHFYFGYNYWNPWRYNYGYHYGYNNWNHNNWYSHNSNNWNGSIQQRPEYGRRERPSTLSSTYNNRMASQERRAPVTQPNRNVSPQNKSTYQENRRTYTPSYDSPRMNTRPAYNNSRTTTDASRSNVIRTQPSTQSRTYSQPNAQVRTQSRTYTAPTRSYSESRSYNNSSQSGSNGFNSVDRRSSGSSYGSSNYSNGSNSSSSSGGSSRSSGGSSGSSGRR
jgi:hypothetical protein